MVKILQFFLFFFLFFFLSKTSFSANFSEINDSLLDKYLKSVINNDSVQYAELVLSKNEMQSLIVKSSEKYSNCITDSETNYNNQNTLNNFSKIKSDKNPVSIKLLNTSHLKGCGLIEGLKVNISLMNEDNTTLNRTLTLIKLDNSYKILFDLESQK